MRKNLDEFYVAEMTAAALEDISAIRLQAIRSGFERNRTFYAGIRDLYGIVRAFGEKTSRSEKKKPSTLLVALTSNKRFYGGLMRQVVQGLARSLSEMPKADAILLGRAGLQYVEQLNLVAKVRLVPTVDDMPTPEELGSLLELFSKYQSVLVLYPKFINPFRQDVGIEDITQSPEAAIQLPEERGQRKKNAPKDTVGFIFEPEVPLILAFFDAQVVQVLFQGVLLEAELARTAARLLRLEEAQERAHNLAKKEEARVRHEAASIAGSELLETFAGSSRWRHI